MRWLKHLSSAHNDEAMSELLDEFGPAGYGVWWIILETIAAQMDKSQRCFARYSVKKWAKTCGISAKKFQKIVSFLSKIEKLSAKNCEKNSDFLIIECPNLLKYRDEYTKKSGQTTDRRRIKSGATPDQETETEAETEAETETEAPMDESLQKAFESCRDSLGMSDQEIQEIYSTCSESEKFAEAVKVALEGNSKQTLDHPIGFIRWAYKSGKTSKQTREKVRKTNGEESIFHRFGGIPKCHYVPDEDLEELAQNPGSNLKKDPETGKWYFET